jgi:predicted class III extradiol MEMO1 family dioxygenase
MRRITPSAEFASNKIRPPAVAGLFYPREPSRLRDLVSEYLAQAPIVGGAAPKALIVPHAGYIYSGSTAAAAYAQVSQRRRDIRRIVLIGPSHRVYLRGMAVPAAEVFQTPLGMVPVDLELKARLLASEQVVEADAPHADEHCLEVQLPFLQMMFDDFTLLPLVIGADLHPALSQGDRVRDPDLSHWERSRVRAGEGVFAQAVAAALAEVWGGKETLVLVSSDLSHYLPYEAARELDSQTIAAIMRHDATLTGEQACGCAGINGLSFLARERGLGIAELARCNSGDTAGDRMRVVGYGAFALHEPGTGTTA